MARFLEEEDALAFAGGSGRAHLSSGAEMGPGLVRVTRFRQKKRSKHLWETGFVD